MHGSCTEYVDRNEGTDEGFLAMDMTKSVETRVAEIFTDKMHPTQFYQVTVSMKKKCRDIPCR